MTLLAPLTRDQRVNANKTGHTLQLSIWIGYLFFVVYGSLVPLDFRPVPLDRAWSIFQHIPMFKLGMESRADWIANGVLYVPVGFLTAHVLMQISGSRRVALFVVTALLSFVLAFAVEFTQIFFPPRTVSLNDLLAECIGTLVGLSLAAKYSDWFRLLLHAVFSNPRRLILHLVEAYLVAYVAYSLFPYDILLSANELAEKMRGDTWGWLLAGDTHGMAVVVLKLLSEIILTLPFGLFLSYRASPNAVTNRQALMLGLLLGGFIEITQLFTASGVSQGVSVLARMAGVWAGVALWRHRHNWSPEKIAVHAQRYVVPASVIYLVVLLYINGWFSHGWEGADSALSRLGDLHFLPFYYHYYTTEAKALFSLASVCFAYLPIGLLVWLSWGSPARAFFYALFVAGVVETGKLFLQGVRPDPTNILLGALAAWGTVHLMAALSAAANMAPTMETGTLKNNDLLSSQSAVPDDRRISEPRRPAARWPAYGVLFPTVAFVAYWAATFPTQPVLLCLFLVACAAIVWHRPAMIVAILPATLPVLDLAPWSGRFFLDEFDLLVLLSLATANVRIPRASHRNRRADLLFTLASSLVVLSLIISAAHSLIPWPALDANSFT
ncbi:MAG: VanZ family protein, partial [Propionivibrio sp.]